MKFRMFRNEFTFEVNLRSACNDKCNLIDNAASLPKSDSFGLSNLWRSTGPVVLQKIPAQNIF